MIITGLVKFNDSLTKKVFSICHFYFPVFLPLIVLFDVLKVDFFIFSYINDFDTGYFIVWNIVSIVFF